MVTISINKDVTRFFTERSDQMISSYITFNQVWDILFAIIYGFMYIIWLSIIYKPYSKKFWLVNLLPLGQVIFDWIENFCLASLSKAYLTDGSISTTKVMIASLSSSFKWGISVLVYFLIAHDLVLRSLKALRNKSVK